jgi:hypothetical protein
VKVTFRCLPELEGLLPRPFPARRGLPQWLKDMALSAPSPEFGGSVKTVKKCPPFLDAMQAGFLMPLPCDITVEDGQFEWDWRDLPPFPRHTPRSPLSFHLASQVTDSPLHPGESLVLKFQNLWTIETEPGWALLVTHPINRPDLPFQTLTGLVDTDSYKDNYVHFPALWTDPGFRGVLPRGTPVAQCVPLRREALELAFEPLDGAHLERLVDAQEGIADTTGSYKGRFRVGRG